MINPCGRQRGLSRAFIKKGESGMQKTTGLAAAGLIAFGTMLASGGAYGGFSGPRTGNFNYAMCPMMATPDAAPVSKVYSSIPITATARQMCYCVRAQVGPEAQEKIECSTMDPV